MENLKAQLLDKSYFQTTFQCVCVNVIFGIWKEEAFMLSLLLLVRKFMMRDMLKLYDKRVHSHLMFFIATMVRKYIIHSFPKFN